MVAPPPPTLRARVDEAALSANWRALDRLSGKASAGAAVKANCYGLGVDRCLPILRDAGARQFFVAHWQEVADVLDHVPPEQVSVLHGLLGEQDAAYARATGVRPVINSLEQARIWGQSGGGLCDLMIDTGINRLGIDPAQLGDTAIQALEIDTLMSHLACADEDADMNDRQFAVFRQCLSAVKHRKASFANSAGIALGVDYAFDLTRPGLALYGGVPREELVSDIRQVAFVEAVLIQTRRLPAGATVGYNATFTAHENIAIGVVSLGYADGILRCWGQSDAAFFSGDRRLPLLGKVSMDMIVIDLSEAPELREGDWVQFPYDLRDAAQQSGLSQYELLTVLGRRLI